MQDFSPEDQYQLSRVQMIANKKALEAQRAQQELDRLVLDLEHKYAILATVPVAEPGPTAAQGFSQIRKSNGKGDAQLIPAVSGGGHSD